MTASRVTKMEEVRMKKRRTPLIHHFVFGK